MCESVSVCEPECVSVCEPECVSVCEPECVSVCEPECASVCGRIYVTVKSLVLIYTMKCIAFIRRIFTTHFYILRPTKIVNTKTVSFRH